MTMKRLLALLLLASPSLTPARAADYGITYDSVTLLVTTPASFWRSNLVDTAELTWDMTGGRAAPTIAASLTRDAELTAALSVLATNLNATTAFSSGRVPIARLAIGTADGTKFVRDDGTLATPTGTGDVVGPASATDARLALFDGATGKLLKVGTLTESSVATDAEVAAGFQPINTNLNNLATAGATGSGAFVRAGSPTLSGTWTFESFVTGTMTVLSNLYAVTVAYGVAWNGSSNVVTRDAAYDYLHVADTDDDGLANKVDVAAAGYLRSSSGGDLSAGTTSSHLASDLADETGTGKAVFGTGPTLDNPTLNGNATWSANPLASSAGAAVILDFAFPLLTITATNNITITQSTNRPPAATNVVWSSILIHGDSVERSLTCPGAWTRLGTNITTIPASKSILLSAQCLGNAESGVLFGIAKVE